MDKSLITERAFRESKNQGYSEKEFIIALRREIGVFEPEKDWTQHRTHWIKRGLPDKYHLPAARFLHVNLEWLVFGTGKKFENGVLPEKLLGLSSELYFSEGDNFRQQAFIPKACPRISTISAGPWMDIADNHPPGFGDGIDYCPVPCSDGTVSFVVSGDSMTAQFGPDTFPHGTTIFVDPNVQAETGSFVIAKVNGSADVTFKQLISDGGRPMLKPLNPQYRIIEAEFRVLGVVIASQRTHR